jgi:hypothetical protein
MENKKQTAVEWLAEKYNYITWMRNRDEISAGTADEWRAKYLEQAKQMEKEQIIDARVDGDTWSTAIKEMRTKYAELYYEETFNTNEK